MTDYDALLLCAVLLSAMTALAGYWMGRATGYRLGLTALMRPGEIVYFPATHCPHCKEALP